MILNASKTWKKLIDHAVNGSKQRSFNLSLSIDVDGETWTAYGAEVSHRDILLFCKQGTATFVVDSYGDRNVVELFDWERSE